MTSAVATTQRPPLPIRPTPHERDGRQPTPAGGRPHPQRSAIADTDPMMSEALRRVIDAQIGPRRPGALYRNVDGAFEVLVLVRDPERARALLRRRCAQWALIVKDVLRPGAEPVAIGSAWTTSDYLVREDKATATVVAVGGMR
ncbi:hypothetical protein ACFZAR_31490 [Streptomyces sp. NPDC008222]|uniref:hypothetical protein n=1 Tax=Streptomyces sp. NPDC008222 TaxID=3364820 RepID=UPI0036F07D95